MTAECLLAVSVSRVCLMLPAIAATAANFCSGDTLRWGLFTPYDGQPHKTYYAFKAFAQMLRTPRRAACTGGDEATGPVIGAGLAADGKAAHVLVAHFAGGAARFRVRLANLPWKDRPTVEVFALDAGHDLESVSRRPLADGNVLELTFPAHGFQLIRLTPSG